MSDIFKYHTLNLETQLFDPSTRISKNRPLPNPKLSPDAYERNMRNDSRSLCKRGANQYSLKLQAQPF